MSFAHRDQISGALRTWAATGDTPTAHVAVGKMDGHVIMRTTHEAPTTALRLDKGGTDYTGMAVQMELARRGPPGGWRWRERHSDPRVVGWVCYDAAEGWRPLLAP